jgi:hypothetical protein
MVLEHSIDIAPCTSEVIIDADDIGALFEQALAEMRAEKSGPSSNEDASFEVHSSSSRLQLGRISCAPDQVIAQYQKVHFGAQEAIQ